MKLAVFALVVAGAWSEKSLDITSIRDIQDKCLTSLGITREDFGRPGSRLGQNSTIVPKFYLCMMRGCEIFDSSDKLSRSAYKRFIVPDYGTYTEEEKQAYVEAVANDCGEKVDSSTETAETRAVLLARCTWNHTEAEQERQRQRKEKK